MFLKKLFPKDEKIPLKDDIKVAIVAIAKNESAYLADWIHHHFYFGFDGIFVGLNRTTDRSKDVIKNIHNNGNYINVFSFDVDWIDKGSRQTKNPGMQSLSYAYLTNCILEQEDTNYTHVLYIDVDEFWFCSDFKTGIKNYIKSLPSFDIVSFNWLMQNGDNEPFSYPFKNLKYTPNDLVKSLNSLEISKKIIEYRAHSPKISASEKDELIRLDSDGLTFISGRHDEVSKKLPDKESTACILHRAVRSEREYIALLRRERPGVEMPIKNNRWGFKLAGTAELEIDPIKLDNYWVSLDRLIKECKISKILSQAKKISQQSCDTIFDIDPLILAAFADIYISKLDGTHKQIEFLEKIQKSKSTLLESPKKSDYGPIFYKCAAFYKARKNHDVAMKYIELALLCRPNGPLILEMRDELEGLMKKERVRD